MKSFSNFIKEASSLASQQAQKMGLIGDGHGDWYDREGNLIAKTVKGRLNIFDRKKKKIRIIWVCRCSRWMYGLE